MKREMKQTAVEWLMDRLPHSIETQFSKQIEQAKELEKQQIMKTARQCHFEGVRQSAKTSQEYIDYAEQYYNETFNK
jgi:hypothetical protein